MTPPPAAPAVPTSSGDPWDRALTTTVLLFVVAAPWSIAVAQMGIVSTALVAVARRFTLRTKGAPLPWTLIAVLAYLAVQALSIPLGVHPGRSLACYAGSWILLFPFLFWDVLENDRRRRISRHVLVASGALAGLYGVVQHRLGVDYLHDFERLENYGGGGYVAVGNLSSHLTYAGVQVAILFLGAGIALGARGWRRALAVIAVGLVGASVLFSFARSAWVGAAVGAAFLLFRGGIKRGLLVLLPAAALVAVVVLQQEALTNRLTSILEITELPRWRLWQTAIRIVADHPILGAGLGAYPTLFPIYKVPGHYMATGHPHHDILNAAVETGVVGALIWLGIWAAFFRETRRASGAAIDWVVEGSRAAVLALLVAGLAQCFSTDEEVGQVWFFVMTAALIDVSRRAPRRRPAVRQLEQWFKRRSLPLARSLLARVPGSAASEDTSSERILVVRPDDRLGNLLLLAPFLQALREVRPQARIGMLVGSRYRDILRAWPWVDVWVVQDKPAHLRRPPEFARWIRSLRRDRWTVALEMSNHNTHSYYSCLLTLASGAPRRIGFDEPRNQGTLTDPVAAPDVDTHFSLAPIALLEAAGWGPPGVPGPVMRCPLPSPPVGGYASSLPPNYLVVHLGGRGEKALAPALWAAVIRTLLGHHRGHVVVLAGPDEQELIPSPAPEVADRVVVAPSLDLITLGHVIADARSYVGCDTGVMHLAVAVGTPTVALFFRSNPLHYAPLGAEHATVLLANPYGVTDAAWDTLQRGLVRSRLLRADEESPDSMRGVPASGPRALAAIDAACRHALRTRPEDRPEDQAKEVRS